MVKEKEKIQDKLKKIQDEDKNNDTRDRKIIVSLVSLFIVVLVAIATFIFINGINSDEPVVEQTEQQEETVVPVEQLEPETVTEYGSFVVSSEGITEDRTRVDTFFDPFCPGCGIVDRGLSAEMSELVDNGKIVLHLYPVAFLDQGSSDNYSTRAVNAFVTIAEHDPYLAMKFMNRILEEDFQPAQGPEYVPVPDSVFVDTAKELGVPDDVAESIANRHYVEWVIENTNEQTLRTDLFPTGFSTPSVFINVEYDENGEASGTEVEFESAEILETFREAMVAETK